MKCTWVRACAHASTHAHTYRPCTLTVSDLHMSHGVGTDTSSHAPAVAAVSELTAEAAAAMSATAADAAAEVVPIWVMVNGEAKRLEDIGPDDFGNMTDEEYEVRSVHRIGWMQSKEVRWQRCQSWWW